MLSWLQVKKRNEKRKARRTKRTYTPLKEQIEKKQEEKNKQIAAAKEKEKMRMAIRRSIFK
ncbi:MAG: hypothetical protein M1365_12590 [Actinobacteria bacterium]|nr:hypothetical protein [Actinomycetota bacterium]